MDTKRLMIEGSHPIRGARNPEQRVRFRRRAGRGTTLLLMGGALLALTALALPRAARAEAEPEITTDLVLGGGAVLHDDPDVQGADHEGT